MPIAVEIIRQRVREFLNGELHYEEFCDWSAANTQKALAVADLMLEVDNLVIHHTDGEIQLEEFRDKLIKIADAE